MASLQHVTHGGRDCWRLRFYIGKRRQLVSLGSFDERAAVDTKEHVEHLLEQSKLNRPPSAKTSRWLDSIPREIYDRLALLGLVEVRAYRESHRTVLAYMRDYIDGRSDWAKPANYKQAVDKLEEYLGRDIPFAALQKAEVERWHRWMIHKKGLSPHTAGQAVKRCRQMMRAAVDDGVAERNPFHGVKIDLKSDKSKNRFIDHDTAIALLDACPDQEWRTLFALCRWGGLRNPSETLRLRWSDIAWDRGRFKVHASKTARYGKGERVVPLFPEVKEELDALFALVEPGVECAADSYVICTYRDTEANLRKAIHRIADVAGVEKWPKPFMCLRSSRRTELERTKRFPNHVLNDWFGHSGVVAEEHYLQTTEDDFSEATSESVVPHVVPSQGNQSRPQPVTKQRNPGKSGAVKAGDGCGPVTEYTRSNRFRDDSHFVVCLTLVSLCVLSLDFIERLFDFDDFSANFHQLRVRGTLVSHDSLFVQQIVQPVLEI